MTAGEAEYPRRTMPRTFRSVFYRLVIFFVLGALCDSKLTTALAEALAAGSSPDVITMENLGCTLFRQLSSHQSSQRDPHISVAPVGHYVDLHSKGDRS